MKKLFITALFAFTLNAFSQSSVPVDLSIKYYDVLTTIKKNSYFSFISKHDKMDEVKDSKGNFQYYELKGSDYVVRFYSDTNIVIAKQSEKYFLTLFGNDLIGHGYIDDSKLHRILTYYFQNDKVIKESVISHK